MEKYLPSFDGCKILYETSGDAKRPCLVFVHGIGQNHTVWEKYMDQFSKNYFCISLDLRGHGKSEYKKISIQNFANDLKSILDAEKINKVSLVGYSLGTQIIGKFYEAYPDLVDKEILIGIFTPETFKISQKVVFWPVSLILRGFFRTTYLLGFRRHKFPYNDYSECHRKRVYGWKAIFLPFLYVIPWHDFSGMHLSAYFDTLGAILSYAPPLSGISVPTLAIQSAEDYFVSFQRTLNSLKENKNVQLDYIDCDHLIIRRKPDQVCEKIQDFLG